MLHFDYGKTCTTWKFDQHTVYKTQMAGYAFFHFKQYVKWSFLWFQRYSYCWLFKSFAVKFKHNLNREICCIICSPSKWQNVKHSLNRLGWYQQIAINSAASSARFSQRFIFFALFSLVCLWIKIQIAEQIWKCSLESQSELKIRIALTHTTCMHEEKLSNCLFVPSDDFFLWCFLWLFQTKKLYAHTCLPQNRLNTRNFKYYSHQNVM